jgi:hypothetical protein
MLKSSVKVEYLEEGKKVKIEEGFVNIKLEDDIIIKKEEYIEGNHVQKKKLTPKKRHGRKRRRAKAKPIAGVKNVVKNYGKAMCSFACSDIATLYLIPILKEEKINRQEFIAWVQNHKERVDSIESLRATLLPDEDENEEVAGYKRAFQKISIVFLKYFCINWIYSGKLTHTQTHLMFWHKMQRRVQNPELFTYLQNPPKRII